MTVNTKILQWGGLLALVAFAGSGIVTWGLVKDRLDITISAEPDETQIDPVALLRDEVAVLRADLANLATALTRNFELLANAGEESNQAAESAILEQLGRIEARMRASTGSEAQVAQQRILDEVRAAVRELRVSASTAPAVSVDPLTANQATAAPDDPPSHSPTVALEPSSVEVAANNDGPPTSAPPVAAPRKRRGFLAFELPASGFEFSQRQRFEVISSLSRVGFDAKSTLHDFSGVTSQVRGQLVLNLGRSSDACSGTVTVDAKSLRTGVDGRDDEMWEHLDVARHPDLEFQLRELVATQTDAAAMRVTGTMKGRLRIRGREQDIEMPVQLSVDDSRRLLIAGEMPLNMTDYEVPVPNQAGLIKVEEVVKMWVSLRARSIGQVTEN